jgi:hypothetical protein
MGTLKTEEREIDGMRFSSTQLPPMKAFVLSKKLLPIVAPLLGGSLAEADMSSFADGFGKLSDDEAIRLALQTLASTSCVVDGERIQLDSEANVNRAFMGSFATMLKVMWFAIGINFFPTGVDALLASSPSKVTASPST